jgi:hypothetical protein
MLTIAVVVLALLIGVIAFGLWAVRSRHTALRRGFRDYLAERRPDLTVTAETSDSLTLQDSEKNEIGTLYLHRLYREAPADPEGWREAFGKVLGALEDAEAAQTLDPEEVRRRILPRIVGEAFLAASARESSRQVPTVALPVDGLFVTFVLDSEHSVAYLPSDQLAELGLDPAAALALAKQNLSRTLASAVVREVMTSRSIRVMKLLDTYDAARLLLLPDLLEPGETLVALIPDRDTLVLAHPPEDGSWAALEAIAKAAEGEPLYPRPLLVTPDGISAAPARS